MNDDIPMTQSENVLCTISEVARLLKVNKDMVYEPMLSAGVEPSQADASRCSFPPPESRSIPKRAETASPHPSLTMA